MARVLSEGMHRCPAHPDRSASLHITNVNGFWLLHCFSLCPTEAILRAWGLTWADLRPPGERSPDRRSSPRPKSEAHMAWDDVMARERRMTVRRAAWLHEWQASDTVRHLRELADLARGWVTRLGDTPGSWALADYAARLERHAGLLESALDGE